jgi:hypothetical protein
MAPASDAETFATTTQLLDCFRSWVHYYLANPTAKGIQQLVTSCQEAVGNPPIKHSLSSRFGRSSCCSRSSCLVEWHGCFSTNTSLISPCLNSKRINRSHHYSKFDGPSPRRGSIDRAWCHKLPRRLSRQPV